MVGPVSTGPLSGGTKSRVPGGTSRDCAFNGCENEFQGVTPETSRQAPSTEGLCVPQTNIWEVETRTVLCAEPVVQYLAIPARYSRDHVYNLPCRATPSNFASV